MKEILPVNPILPVLTDAFFDIEEEAIFDGCHFTKQDLSYATGDNLVLRGCRLDNLIFNKSKFERFECSNVIFDHCDLSNVEWFGGSFHQVVFKNCKLTGTNLADSYLRDCQFEDCIGEFVSFSNTDLKTVTFTNCQIPRSEFFELRWKNLRLENCDLDDSNWMRTKLTGLDFRSDTFEKIALTHELLKGLQVNQFQAICIAAGLGLLIED